MISLSFALRNPWSQRFRLVTNWCRVVSKHKSVELDVYHSNCILEFSINITGFRQDHAGWYLGMGILGYNADVTLYDHRHTDEC